MSTSDSIFLCRTCGTSYPEAAAPPNACRICEDERQWVPASGQAWTTGQQLAAGHRNAWQRLERDLFSIQTVPVFAINQRALIVRTPHGNVLWDCIALLDDATRELISALGGLAAIAISHPHYYTTMQDWADAFSAPLYLHAADAQWICRPSDRIVLWAEDEREILPDIRLVRCGGHFAGGTVLHRAGQGGLLLVGDIVQITPGAHHVSFMWSYPNMLPLSAVEVTDVGRRLARHRFQRMFGAFDGQNIRSEADGIVQQSVARYVERLTG